MTNADIQLLPTPEDSILRSVTIRQGGGDQTAVSNAIWLMEICINAFSDAAGLFGSVAAFKAGAGLETVIASGCYGDPPGLGMTETNQGQQYCPPVNEMPPPMNFQQNFKVWF